MGAGGVVGPDVWDHRGDVDLTAFRRQVIAPGQRQVVPVLARVICAFSAHHGVLFTASRSTERVCQRGEDSD